ncbi:MAG: histidine phosphatase family protein [Acidobacteriia bacterium]|nr:histidine phosphatase family protein [Terriglobia bacterium]
MAKFYLIRHGENDMVGKALAGWMPGVHLNATGRAQAERLAARLLTLGVDRIYASPLERAQETAEPIAGALGLNVETRESLGEFPAGEWTGKTFRELEDDPKWQIFNQYRSGTRVPGGELMLETQTRIVAELLCLRDRHEKERIAVVSHADPIRAALTFFLGMPLDFYRRMEVSPGSYTTLELEDWGPIVLNLNQSCS